MSFAQDVGDLSALESACTGSPAPELFARRVLAVAAALAALADTHVLQRIATDDVATAMVKMLGRCVECESNPPAAALAYDIDTRWFDVSAVLCYGCFVDRAVILHGVSSARARDVVAEPPLWLTVERLLDRGAVRELRIGLSECERVLEGHTDYIMAVAYSPDGTAIATGGGDNVVEVLDVVSGERLCTLDVVSDTDWILAVAYSPDGKTIATASEDEAGKLWEVETGICHNAPWDSSVMIMALTYSPDGKTIATVSSDQTAKLWDLVSGKCRDLREGTHVHKAWSVAFSPDGMAIATGAVDQTVRLWDAASGQCHRALAGHVGVVTGVAFSPDGAMVASAGHDKTVRLWDVAVGECRRVVCTSMAYDVAWSPDGTTIATSSGDKSVRLWQIDHCRGN